MVTPTESVLLNGTVGSGKTTTAEALHQLLVGDRISNAVIDLDELRRSWPVPDGDPYNHELERRNLDNVAANYRKAGVQRFILAGVLEHPSEVDRYKRALGEGKLTVVRLRPPIETVQKRLRNRHEPDTAELSWYLHRSVELHGILNEAGLEDHVVAFDNEPPKDVAHSVRTLLGW